MGSFNNHNLPLVSICIPAYNAESTIAETLETVLAQDYPCLDIVVSDNQSTDNTKVIVEQYVDHGVRYVYHSDGRPDWAAKMSKYIGGFANWNYVLSQGHGDYLCLFHSDDLYEPSIVRKQISVMQENPQVGAVFTQARIIGEDGRPIKMGIARPPNELKGQWKFDFPSLLNTICASGNFLLTPSVMLRRSVVKQVGGFDERHFLTSADLEMWLRIAHEGYEVAIVDQPLLKYRISQRQFGAQYNKLRTTLWDFFGVLDQYLNQPGVRAMVQQQSLALYELHRANDQVRCAMNLLVQGKVADARALLGESLRWQCFVTAVQHQQLLANLTVGLGFLVSAYLGLGPWVGAQAYQVHLRRMQRLCEPLGGEQIE